MDEIESQLQPRNEQPSSRRWVWARRAAFAGFLFFLIKGLVWVGVGVVVAMQVF